METLNNFLIYALQSPKKRHNLYVGQTKDYEGRMKAHQDKDSNCRYLLRAIKKYKWENFKRIVLIEGLTKEQANFWEKHYIKIFDCQAPNGMNLTSGGDSYEFSQIARDRMTASQNKPEVKAKLKAAAIRYNAMPGVKGKKSAALSKLWQDPEFRANQVAKRMGNQNTKGMKFPPESAETRAKKSAALMGNTNCLGKQNALGCKHTPEACARKSARLMGNQRAKGKRSDGARANYSAAKMGQDNPNSLTNKRRRFIAKCFDNKVFLWD